METLCQQAVLFPPSEPKKSIIWGRVRVTAPLTQPLDDLLIARRGQNIPGIRKSRRKCREGEQCRIKAQKWAEDNHRRPQSRSCISLVSSGSFAKLQFPWVSLQNLGQSRSAREFQVKQGQACHLSLKLVRPITLHCRKAHLYHHKHFMYSSL